MEAELWQRPSRSSNVQPPWERESSSSSIHNPTFPASHAANHGYLYAPSPLPSPMQLAFGRTESFSGSPSGHLDSPQRFRSSSFSENAGRRQSISGPLPSQGPTTLQDFLGRKSSLSGPLPSSNPYLSDPAVSPESLQGQPLADLRGAPVNADPVPPLRTPPPWSELRQGEADVTNPYLNPRLYNMPAAATLSPGLSSNGTSSPSTLSPSGRSPAELTPSGRSPSVRTRSLRNVGHKEVARQLYSHKQQDSLSPLINAASASFSPNSSPSALSGDYWSPSSDTQAGVVSKLSRMSMDGPSPLSQGSGSPSLSPLQLARDIEINGTRVSGESQGYSPQGAIPKARKPPNGVLSRSASVRSFSAANGGRTASPSLSRSMSFDSVVNGGTQASSEAHYTKARSLVDGVVENLVVQLVRAQDRPNVLADMIFCTSKLSMSGALVSPFASARLFVERILLVQLRALTPNLMGIASDPESFEGQKWALKGRKTVEGQEDFSNEGLRLLRLQKMFVELGLETFDALCKLRSQLPNIVPEGGSNASSSLCIACIGGDPGCSALALYLFFLRLCPSLQVQVDFCAGVENWKDIVDAVSLKGIGFLCMNILELIRHPSVLRSYKLVVFVNTLGEKMKEGPPGRWQEFWNNLYQNTSAMVLIIIYECTCRWEEMAPNRGQWWFSSVPDQDSLHIVRKI